MDKINKAFITLLQDKQLSEITVSDICKAANINRSTFYEKYEDISALANDRQLRAGAKRTDTSGC